MKTEFCVCVFAVYLISFTHGRPELDPDGQHPASDPDAEPRYITKPTDWNLLAQQELQRALNTQPIVKQAKNVIFFLGDGMGVSTMTAARIYKAQTRPDDPDTMLSFEKFPHMGLSKTHNVDKQVPDSAATGTAFLCGEKANYYTLGVSQNVKLNNCTAVAGNKLRSVLKHSMDEGKWTGIVTNTRITHATPASAYAHAGNRNWESSIPDSVVNGEMCDDIAKQLVDVEENRRIRVVLGGGLREFVPNHQVVPGTQSYMGRRKDNRTLVEDWLQYKQAEGLSASEYKFVGDKTEFDAIDANSIQYLMGLFDPEHMDYEHDRISSSPPTQPSLTEMMEKSISILKRSANGYFLLVEGGRIDHAHHDNTAFRSLNETVAFSDAIARAVELTDDQETLIVVTADHSHVFTIGGYPDINNPIFSVNDHELGDDGKPYLTLGYANGPGFMAHRTVNGSLSSGEVPRMNLSGIDTGTPEYLQDSTIPIQWESHGGEDVAIFARGPMAHLFQTSHPQHYIAHVMNYASCVGPNKELCGRNPPTAPPCASTGTKGACLGHVLTFVMIALSLVMWRA